MSFEWAANLLLQFIGLLMQKLTFTSVTLETFVLVLTLAVLKFKTKMTVYQMKDAAIYSLLNRFIKANVLIFFIHMHCWKSSNQNLSQWIQISYVKSTHTELEESD